MANPNSNIDPDAALSTRLFIVVCLVVTFVASLLVFGLWAQWHAYNLGISVAAASVAVHSNTLEADHSALITYARSLGAAVNKTSALFLGFIMVFTGILYVLRTTTTKFSLTGAHDKTKSALETTSPGLVIVTLGTLLTIMTIITKSEVEYHDAKGAETNSSGQSKGISNIPQNPTGKMEPSLQEDK